MNYAHYIINMRISREDFLSQITENFIVILPSLELENEKVWENKNDTKILPWERKVMDWLSL